MFVVWRRPDGFHGASPGDFVAMQFGGGSRIWLHRAEKDWYPFRVSGGWQDDEHTKRLNRFANLLGAPGDLWVDHLVRSYGNSMGDEPVTFLRDLETWLAELRGVLKGDKWEVEILAEAFDEIARQIRTSSGAFLEAVAGGERKP